MHAVGAQLGEAREALGLEALGAHGDGLVGGAFQPRQQIQHFVFRKEIQ